MSCSHWYMVLGDRVTAGQCLPTKSSCCSCSAAELQWGRIQLLNRNKMNSSLRNRFQTKSNLFAQFQISISLLVWCLSFPDVGCHKLPVWRKPQWVKERLVPIIRSPVTQCVRVILINTQTKIIKTRQGIWSLSYLLILMIIGYLCWLHRL